MIENPGCDLIGFDAFLRAEGAATVRFEWLRINPFAEKPAFFAYFTSKVAEFLCT
jgi:hypothetical protein